MPLLMFPSLVRDQILDQHVELRALLGRALTSAGGAEAGAEAGDPERLAVLARELCQRFRAHLTFEEEALKPVFFVLDSWGPERVRALDDEHARQRRELDALLARFESEGDAGALARALRSLAADLLRDMEEEERGCLQAGTMSAGFLEVERR